MEQPEAEEVTDYRQAQRRLRDHLAAVGALQDPAWARCHDAVPRHLFIPETIWTDRGDGYYVPVSRSDDPDLWLDACYSDHFLVTQVDDGAPAGPDGTGDVLTSSASMPSMVFGMLHHLDVGDGMRVLEVGTATGYNAALLCCRVGDGNVTTVEIDAGLAADGLANLAAAGFFPQVITGDGADGYPGAAPFDRVIATCSVRDVPYSWVAQTRPGGVIVVPWHTTYAEGGALARLTVSPDGTASGPLVGPAAFMTLRAQRLAPVDVHRDVHDEDQAEDSATKLSPRVAAFEEDAEFAIGLLVNARQYIGRSDPASEEFTLWLLDSASGSWAAADYVPGTDVFEVSQHGPRRLWDEVEAACRWWDGAGRPALTRFGLTVGADGDQAVWLDSPDHVLRHA
ncbi:hypothetical protein NE236_33295 [Actinoallomurus purpureus]|uniref:hypothetical protein n=1 Tax=Actinoallomurus purpureus TaxID=478114 RepID=UPI0020937438|nr:hypothetical protein [Actinoallomurus purpureus]MCO6009859.1 hypothetical protein [Actinoallomurus purpureus]